MYTFSKPLFLSKFKPLRAILDTPAINLVLEDILREAWPIQNVNFFHGDKRVTIFKETGKFEPGGEYIPPNYAVPTLYVSTEDGYKPGLSKIVEFTNKHTTMQLHIS